MATPVEADMDDVVRHHGRKVLVAMKKSRFCEEKRRGKSFLWCARDVEQFASDRFLFGALDVVGDVIFVDWEQPNQPRIRVRELSALPG
jgi:hypothetical protein